MALAAGRGRPLVTGVAPAERLHAAWEREAHEHRFFLAHADKRGMDRHLHFKALAQSVFHEADKSRPAIRITSIIDCRDPDHKV